MNGKPLVFLAAITLVLVGCNKEEGLITPTEMDQQQQTMPTASITSNNDNAVQATIKTVTSDQSTPPLVTSSDQRNKNILLKDKVLAAPEAITSTGNNVPSPVTQNNAASDVTIPQDASDQSSSVPPAPVSIKPVDMNPQAPYGSTDTGSADNNNVMPVDED